MITIMLYWLAWLHFFNTSHFCWHCLKGMYFQVKCMKLTNVLINTLIIGIDKLSRHNCTGKCRRCRDVTCPASSDLPSLKCARCNRYFLGEQCLQKHISNKTCEDVQRCAKCFLYIYKGIDHTCGLRKCIHCKELVIKGHLCYIQKPLHKDCRVSSDNEEAEQFRGNRKQESTPPLNLLF